MVQAANAHDSSADDVTDILAYIAHRATSAAALRAIDPSAVPCSRLMCHDVQDMQQHLFMHEPHMHALPH